MQTIQNVPLFVYSNLLKCENEKQIKKLNRYLKKHGENKQSKQSCKVVKQKMDRFVSKVNFNK
jgi:hypothetical protein